MYLQTFGLRKENALDYFYLSPFFDVNSNNQLIRTQGVSIEHLRSELSDFELFQLSVTV
jgi:hypothetical protein